MLHLRPAVLTALAGLAACSAPVNHPALHAAAVSCTDRATQIVAENAGLITDRRYAAASRAAERAARVSLSCAEGPGSQRFVNRWRGGNALVVAAELAHEANDVPRARRLLHEGYAILHGLKPPRHASELTSTLIAQKLDSARSDLAGQWAYW